MDTDRNLWTSHDAEMERPLPRPLQSCLPPGGARRPEQALMLAVMEDALHTLRRCRGARRPRDRRALYDVEAWCAADDFQSPFSFVHVCEALGVDPDAVRQQLSRWSDHPAAEHEPPG